jgi:hypothetical protein
LLSAAEITVVPPAVRMLGRPLVTGGTEYAFSLVVFSSRPAYTSGDQFEVRGPNGYVAPVEVTRARVGQSHSLLSCRVDAPGVEFDRSDNGLYTVGWRTDPRAAGVALASSSSTPFGRFRVFSSAAPEAPPALPLSDRATAGALSVTFNRMAAWCDHMPWAGPEPAREYLVIETTLTNTSDRPLEVTLSRAYISFDENDVGEETHGISIRSPHGPPTGVKTLVLQPGETRVVQFRGNGVYPEDRHGQRLYVTLEFTADGATAAVRNSGVVMVSW